MPAKTKNKRKPHPKRRRPDPRWIDGLRNFLADGFTVESITLNAPDGSTWVVQPDESR